MEIIGVDIQMTETLSDKKGCGKQVGRYPTLDEYGIKPYCGEILTNYTEGEENDIRLCSDCKDKLAGEELTK